VTIPYLHCCIAEQMRHELASRRLEVVLVPSPVEYWPTEQQRRVVCERNPKWYRELCRQYESNRTRPRRRRKSDTLIKRAHTLRALAEIEDGSLDTEYAKRVYPFVVKEAEKYIELHGSHANTAQPTSSQQEYRYAHRD